MNYTLNCLSLDYANILFVLCNIMYLYPPWHSEQKLPIDISAPDKNVYGLNSI